MSLRHGLFTLLAALHLIWAACSALGRPWIPENRQAQKLVRLYGAFSGVDNTFGFFAPDCGSQTRATFILTDAAGQTWNDTLERGANRECNLRLGGFVDTMFALSIDDQNQIYSWAASVLGRNPTAVTCQVRIESYSVPTMADYHSGKRPDWQSCAEMTFARTASQGLVAADLDGEEADADQSALTTPSGTAN